MSALLTEDIGAIIDNYADVIEGRASYRGSGTEYAGVPGVGSNLDGLINETGNSVTAASDGSTTGFYATESLVGVGLIGIDDGRANWNNWEGPRLYLLCTASNGDGAPNLNAHRPIGNYTDSSKSVLQLPAWDGAVKADDTFTILEGFKRLPDNAEVFDEGNAFDRYFHFELNPGQRSEWYGNGREHYTGTLTLYLRMQKRARMRRENSELAVNMNRIASALTRSEHRGDYVKGVFHEAPWEPAFESDVMIVASQSFRIEYSIARAFNG